MVSGCVSEFKDMVSPAGLVSVIGGVKVSGDSGQREASESASFTQTLRLCSVFSWPA